MSKQAEQIVSIIQELSINPVMIFIMICFSVLVIIGGVASMIVSNDSYSRYLSYVLIISNAFAIYWGYVPLLQLPYLG